MQNIFAMRNPSKVNYLYFASIYILIHISIMKITDKVREIRTQKNLSQEYLASYLGIDTSSYHRIERGVSPLSIQRLEKIAEALEINLIELFSFEQPENQSNPHDVFINHLEDEIRFLRKQLQEKIDFTNGQSTGKLSFSPKNASQIVRV